MKGLAVHTAKIIDQVSMLECIKPYHLVGGTALSLQLHHRLSEDLDFMRWPSGKEDKMEVDWVGIEKELKTVGELQKTEIMGFEHVSILTSGDRFANDAGFKRLAPVYDVSVDEIVEFMGNHLKDIYK